MAENETRLNRPDNDPARPERTPPEERRDWEQIQVNAGDDYTERLRVLGGWLYRTVAPGGGVAMVFVGGNP